AEENEQYKQRVPVDLIMQLENNLFNPDIGFNIELPGSSEIIQNRVNSAISTEEEMNRQAFALLVLRRFISPPNISKQHNAIGLAENSTELLSSQLSNWLSQISNDFDVGVNYRPGDDISNEELAVALSTQLFNDRLRVSGNFGVAANNNAQQQQANNVIGDLMIEWKMLENGKIKLIVYNQSNDYDVTNTNISPYTQGIGIVFQEEFNTLSELFQLQEN
ncbi:MAG: translocation/assembly module TamB, partial [Bacteroidota bacterium]